MSEENHQIWGESINQSFNQSLTQFINSFDSTFLIYFSIFLIFLFRSITSVGYVNIFALTSHRSGGCTGPYSGFQVRGREVSGVQGQRHGRGSGRRRIWSLFVCTI